MTGQVSEQVSSGVGDRYGARSPWRRRGIVIGSALLAAVFLGWLVWAIALNSDPEVTSQLQSFNVQDDHTVDVVLQVHLSNPQVKATCTVQALGVDHSVVGQRPITPKPAEGETQRFEVRTDRRATTVQSSGCTAPGQDRAR